MALFLFVLRKKNPSLMLFLLHNRCLSIKNIDKTLSEVVGQNFVRHVAGGTQKNRFLMFYLFSAQEEPEKQVSRILAKALNCQHPAEDGDPCNVCEHCTGADAGNFVDLIEIDGASNRKIEHARALIEKFISHRRSENEKSILLTKFTCSQKKHLMHF